MRLLSAGVFLLVVAAGLFGEKTWLRRGEAFSVFFGLLSRFAPTEVWVKDPAACNACAGSTEGGCVNCYGCFERAAPEDRELNLSPPAVGLSREERVPAGCVAFVVLVLASVTFDGLLGTALWAAFWELLPGLAAVETLGLVAAPLAFGALYLFFVWLSGVFGGGGPALGSLAAGYVFSLVPIAVAYHAAHFLTYLLIQGQAIFTLVSDPFGFGWDLFGTAGYEPDPAVVGAAPVVLAGRPDRGRARCRGVPGAPGSLGHFGSPERALRSQYPVLALMSFYAVFSLWILAQPIVE